MLFFLKDAGMLFTTVLWVSCCSLYRYASLYASSLVQQLRKEDDIYIRPLGNVIYLMCGPCTPQDSCTRQLLKVHRRLCELNWAGWEYSWWEQIFGVEQPCANLSFRPSVNLLNAIQCSLSSNLKRQSCSSAEGAVPKLDGRMIN